MVLINRLFLGLVLVISCSSATPNRTSIISNERSNVSESESFHHGTTSTEIPNEKLKNLEDKDKSREDNGRSLEVINDFHSENNVFFDNNHDDYAKEQSSKSKEYERMFNRMELTTPESHSMFKAIKDDILKGIDERAKIIEDEIAEDRNYFLTNKSKTLDEIKVDKNPEIIKNNKKKNWERTVETYVKNETVNGYLNKTLIDEKESQNEIKNGSEVKKPIDLDEESSDQITTNTSLNEDVVVEKLKSYTSQNFETTTLTDISNYETTTISEDAKIEITQTEVTTVELKIEDTTLNDQSIQTTNTPQETTTFSEFDETKTDFGGLFEEILTNSTEVSPDTTTTSTIIYDDDDEVTEAYFEVPTAKLNENDKNLKVDYFETVTKTNEKKNETVSNVANEILKISTESNDVKILDSKLNKVSVTTDKSILETTKPILESTISTTPKISILNITTPKIIIPNESTTRNESMSNQTILNETKSTNQPTSINKLIKESILLNEAKINESNSIKESIPIPPSTPITPSITPSTLITPSTIITPSIPTKPSTLIKSSIPTIPSIQIDTKSNTTRIKLNENDIIKQNEINDTDGKVKKINEKSGEDYLENHEESEDNADDNIDVDENIEDRSNRPIVVVNYDGKITVKPIRTTSKPLVKIMENGEIESNNIEPKRKVVEEASRKVPIVIDLEVTTTPAGLVDDGDGDEEGNGGKIAAIVISTVGAVCLLLLVGLLVVMRKRQKRFNYGQRCRPVSLDAYSMDNVSIHNSTRRKGVLMTSKRAYGNAAFDDPNSPSHRLNFSELVKFANNQEEISKEFEEIPQVQAKTSELPAGCEVKNRYANVIPLPETRVFLKTIEGDPTSDYINANYVTGAKSERKYYIACQAPLQSTIGDFWRMVWEQESKVILMLTHLYEQGTEKCADYLPPSEVLDCNRLFGDFQVTLKKREVRDKYIISSLQLKNMVSNSWREVTHIWYVEWPHKGVPEEANSLIRFLIEARSYMKVNEVKAREANTSFIQGTIPRNPPVIVHCSPGTGRTGTVISCDIAIREFEQSRQVDIPKIVYKLRRDRASSVQTKEQYSFIYKVINLYATKLTGGAFDSF